MKGGKAQQPTSFRDGGWFSLRWKLFLAMVGVSLIPIAFLSWRLLGTLFAGIDQLEQERLTDSLDRVERAIDAVGSEMLANVLDYSHWDEMYFPETGRDPDWLQLNVFGWVPRNYQIDTIIMADRDGKVYASFAPPAEMVSDVSEYLFFRNALEGIEKHGFYQTSHGMMMIASAYISRTNVVGVPYPPKEASGVLIYGRLVDSETAQHFTDVTGRSVSFFDEKELIGTSDPDLAGNLGREFSRLAPQASRDVFRKMQLREKGPERLVLYHPLRSYDGGVIGALRVGQDRETENFVRMHIRDGVVYTSLLAAAFSIALSYFLGLRLSRPIRSLAKGMREYATGKPFVPVVTKSKDEIGELGKSFTYMTRELDASQASLKEKDKALEGKVNDLERMNHVMIGRELRMIQLKKELARLQKGKSSATEE